MFWTICFYYAKFAYACDNENKTNGEQQLFIEQYNAQYVITHLLQNN